MSENRALKFLRINLIVYILITKLSLVGFLRFSSTFSTLSDCLKFHQKQKDSVSFMGRESVERHVLLISESFPTSVKCLPSARYCVGYEKTKVRSPGAHPGVRLANWKREGGALNSQRWG